MIEATIEMISDQDILSLIERRVGESRSLEFKRELPGPKDDDVKEFLADVTSLANTGGGDVMFGIEEVGGAAAALTPIAADRADAALLRLESLLKDGIEPRLPGTRLRWISLGADGGVILVRVAASLAGPHRVKFRNWGKFFGRNSRGKFELDTFELRQAFTSSDQLPARVRGLHEIAVSTSFGGLLPFRQIDEPSAVATIVPLGLLREARSFDINFENALLPHYTGRGFEHLNTLEGVVVYSPADIDQQRPYEMVGGYALTHWSGRIDAVWSVGGERELQPGRTDRLVWAKNFEGGLTDAGTSTMAKLNALGVDGPWAVLVTVTGLKGYSLVLDAYRTSAPAWRDQAALPELVVEHISAAALEPLFKAFWLLFGQLRPATQSRS
jgi:hypothetical protein